MPVCKGFVYPKVCRHRGMGWEGAGALSTDLQRVLGELCTQGGQLTDKPFSLTHT